jgi:hypothetical protein
MYGTNLMDETGQFFEPFACPGQGIEPTPQKKPWEIATSL